MDSEFFRTLLEEEKGRFLQMKNLRLSIESISESRVHLKSLPTEQAEAVCDACNSGMRFADGYALTTKQVVLAEGYWEVAFRGAYKGLAVELNPAETEDDPKVVKILAAIVAQQAGQDSAWLVCEKCSKRLEFDRQIARHHAETRVPPPGIGPVRDLMAVLTLALGVRRKVFFSLLETDPQMRDKVKHQLVASAQAREELRLQLIASSLNRRPHGR